MFHEIALKNDKVVNGQDVIFHRKIHRRQHGQTLWRDWCARANRFFQWKAHWKAYLFSA